MVASRKAGVTVRRFLSSVTLFVAAGLACHGSDVKSPLHPDPDNNRKVADPAERDGLRDQLSANRLLLSAGSQARAGG